MRPAKPKACCSDYTLVFSMTVFSPALQASQKQVADEFNKILPAGINTSLRDMPRPGWVKKG